MTADLLARVRATDRSFAQSTATHIELTETKLAAAGIDDFDELRSFVEANGGVVRRTPPRPSSGMAPLGVPRPVIEGRTSYWLPRTLLND